ncbi:MAG: lytic transglycosylase domain-containing protein, partial [Myxococcales bacterium]
PELGLVLRRRIATAIMEESRAAGFDPLFILAVIDVESDFLESAVSNKGARGLMQIRPATLEFIAAKEGFKLPLADLYRDPALQVRVGVRYLARLEKRFRSQELALMAYNAGPERLKQSLKEGDIERFRGYARAVQRDYARFRRRMQLENEAALAQAELAPPAGIPEPASPVDEGKALP